MNERSSHQGFDSFRLERKRIQHKIGASTRPATYENETLRELEAVEQREVRDQQLTREVHEFFASATRQAAGIVERVARDAQAAAGERIEQEMESFLIDALARMNTFVVTVLQHRRTQVAEQQLEPSLGNLVGQSLDEFRWAGTAEVGDKHIGQDPFATDLDDVRREFRTAAGAEAANAAVTPVEEHLAARHGEGPQDVEPAPKALAAAASPKPAPAAALPAAESPVEPPPAAPVEASAEELERFKSALKSLVKAGTMTRDEARAAWQTRLKMLGLATG